MTLVADNDAILKLCAYNLWDEACEVVGVTPGDIRTLVQARFVFRRFRGQSDKVGRYTVDGIDRALAVAASASPVDLPDDPTDLDALLAAARRLDPSKLPIDPGEAGLFVATAHLGASGYLTTGDKRAVVGLAAVSGVDDMRARLAGKVWCLEHILYRLVQEIGLGLIQDRVRAVPACDLAIRTSFGVSEPVPLESVLEGLSSQIRQLRASSGDLLVEA